jgi:hypothetical protein
MKHKAGAIGLLAAAVLTGWGINAIAEEGGAGKKPAEGRRPRMHPAEMFKIMDKDQDGKVTRAEFMAAHEQRAKKAFERSGSEGSFEEFYAPRKTRAEEHFKKLDADGNGEVTKAEHKALIKKREGKRWQGGDRNKCGAEKGVEDKGQAEDKE